MFCMLICIYKVFFFYYGYIYLYLLPVTLQYHSLLR